MSKLIYLDPDEEITDVIDKISKIDSKSLSLVIPRGSTLANSIVNLKLLIKRSRALKKDVALVTNDPIAHNLASQIGLSVYESIDDAKHDQMQIENEEPERENLSAKPLPTKEISGVKVHQYDRGEDQLTAGGLPSEDLAGENPEPEVMEAVIDEDGPEENPETEVKTEQPAEKADYKLIKKPMNHDQKLRENLKPQPALDSQIFGKMRNAKDRKKRIILIIAGAVALLLIIGAYIALPKAEVTVSVAAEPFSTTADITVSKDATGVDTSNATIPGQLINKEEEQSEPFAASGSKNVGKAASGKITVYNNWDQNPISLPAGTKFVTGGAEFDSTAAATIPGAQVGLQNGQFVITASGTADVNVSAVAVGAAGNIGPSTFTIMSLPAAEQSKVYGKSSAAFSGGSDSIVKVITDGDLANAKTTAEKDLLTKVNGEVKSGLQSNQILLDSAQTSSIESESASNKSGDQVDTFTYDVKMQVQALVFSQDDFQNALLANAKSKLESGKDIVSSGQQSLTYTVKSADLANGKLTLTGSFSGFVASKLDAIAMKSAIRFKSINSATTKLTSYPGVLSASISTTPSFLRTLPALSNRITINFNYGQ